MIYRQNRRWLPYIELAAVAAIIVAIYLVYRLDWLAWSLNPFMFLILYFALRYGNRVGVMAAAGVSLLHIAAYLSVHGDMYGLFDRWEQAKWFICYWGIALFVGHVASDLRFKYSMVADELEEMNAQLAKVEGSYRDLHVVKKALETKVIGAQESLFTLYRIAKALDSEDSEIIFTDAVRLCKDLIQAGSIVIYRMNQNGDVLRLKVYYGPETRYPATVFLDKPSIYSRVREEKSIQMRLEGEPLDVPIMAGPLLDQNQNIVAVIGLNGMDLVSLNKYTLDLFRLILTWMGESCVKAFERERKLKDERYFPGTKVMVPEYFYAKLNEEALRETDFDQKFLLLKLPVELGDMEESAALLEINELTQRMLRDEDAMSYDAFRGELLFLLPATSPELAALIEERIRNRFDRGA
ncbi:hypothetical protein ACFPES_35125 [Paenibacillus sp. GCM10023248]|uniref:hypothetical protein n=1 Tax=Bacillales TaxID=1385 RepID=UPI002378C693|nr:MULTISPECIES: hypothetical protein [Bacillales]MDD9272245.1 hypothetical protein [Paenibacillus sp. MAHUQ-63]MDR6885372.1 hypothetical protein [Bacillus sp. 3255]